jgi:hypothetical protein
MGDSGGGYMENGCLLKAHLSYSFHS